MYSIYTLYIYIGCVLINVCRVYNYYSHQGFQFLRQKTWFFENNRAFCMICCTV